MSRYTKGGAGNPRSYPVSNIMTSFTCWVCGKKCRGGLKDCVGKLCMKCDLLQMDEKLKKHDRILKKRKK